MQDRLTLLQRCVLFCKVVAFGFDSDQPIETYDERPPHPAKGWGLVEVVPSAQFQYRATVSNEGQRHLQHRHPFAYHYTLDGTYSALRS